MGGRAYPNVVLASSTLRPPSAKRNGITKPGEEGRGSSWGERVKAGGGGDEGGGGRGGAGVQGGRGYCIWEVQICAALCAASNKGRIAFDCGGL